MAKKKEGNPGITYIVGGFALLFTVLLIYLVIPALYQLHCPVSGGFYAGPCSFGDSLLMGIVTYVLMAVSGIVGLILIGMGIYRNTRSK